MCSSHDSPNVEPIELQEVVSCPEPRPRSGSTRVHSTDEDGSIATEGEAETTSAAMHSHEPEEKAAMNCPLPQGKKFWYWTQTNLIPRPHGLGMRLLYTRMWTDLSPEELVTRLGKLDLQGSSLRERGSEEGRREGGEG